MSLFATATPSVYYEDFVSEVCVRPLDVTKQQIMAAGYVEEIVAALKLMDPSNAMGSDGFHAGFYQKYWSFMESNITSLALKFLNGVVLLQTLIRRSSFLL